jgi:hypothetical protein
MKVREPITYVPPAPPKKPLRWWLGKLFLLLIGAWNAGG